MLSSEVVASPGDKPITARIINAPNADTSTDSRKSIFLAGTTDPATAADWRDALTKHIVHLPITIYNPLRPDWDATWSHDIACAPFRVQVEWELNMLESADVVAVYFAPGSQAPITLLELGLFVRARKCVVACPLGFWRRGNVEIVCARYEVPMVESLDELMVEVARRLES